MSGLERIGAPSVAARAAVDDLRSEFIRETTRRLERYRRIMRTEALRRNKIGIAVRYRQIALCELAITETVLEAEE